MPVGQALRGPHCSQAPPRTHPSFTHRTIYGWAFGCLLRFIVVITNNGGVPVLWTCVLGVHTHTQVSLTA